MAEKGSDLIYDFCCNVCEEDSVSKEAMFYCQPCAKGFCDDCIGIHKQLYKKHEPYGRAEMNMWPVAKRPLEDLKFCRQHTDHLIEMFCEDHSKLCCSLCHFHEHRHCVKLSLVKDKAQEMNDAGDFHQMAITMVDVQQNLKSAVNDTQECLKKLQDSYDKAYEEIKMLRKKVNDILDELETQTIQALDNMLQTLKQSLQSDADKCSIARNDFQKINDSIRNIGASPAELSFIAYRTSLEMVSQAENLLKEMAINRNVTIAFRKNPDVEQMLSRLSSFGDIERLKNQTETAGSEIIKCSNKYLYNVRISSSSKRCDIRGICELSGGDILIVDLENKRVKLLDKQYNVVAHKDLPASAYDMCSISPTEVAVIVDDSSKTHAVQFLTVNNRQIVKGRVLNFGHTCFGIAYGNGNLYITSRTALYQYTLGGELMKKIYEDTSGEHTVYKCAVSPDGTRLYVTNHKHHKLLTLSMDGTLLSSWEDPEIRNPRGVHVSETGQLLVCEDGSHSVVQVDGKGVMITLASKKDGLHYPEYVYCSARTGRMIVGDLSDKILVINTE